MKRFWILLLLVQFSCGDKSTTDTTPAQNSSTLVTPKQTDANYSSSDLEHYVVRNNKTHLNKLLLFIGGSFSVPKDYNLICDQAATFGLDVISLSYPNDVAAASLGTSTDLLIFDKYRDEICFGNAVSNVVSVDVLNSINIRATKLVLYLKSNFPNENWGQYLNSSNTLQWDKIIVSGHSQGSGHACYLAKKNSVERVVMLSGPNDYSTNFSAPGNWLTVSGLTPITKHFALLHTKDEIVPFDYQVANLKGLGLLTAAQSPTLVDNLASPYNNAKALSLNIPANSYHSSSVGANAILPNVWKYMFTVSLP
jgi:hypothetical protein